jgi:hypothetical protein
MAMIFTEQENIDDVIFFPLLRPAVSPLNALIYGVEESPPAPVEDLALSFDDFAALCRDGAIRPHSRHLVIKPHVRLWHTRHEGPRAIGQAEIEGFLPNGLLHLAGFKAKPEETPHKAQVLERLEAWLVALLRANFPECRVTVAQAPAAQEK